MTKQRKSYLIITAISIIISLILMGYAHAGEYDYKMSCEGVAVGALVDARAEGEDPRNLRATLSYRDKDGHRIYHIYPERRVDGVWIPIGIGGMGWWSENANQRDPYTIIKTLSYHNAVIRWLMLTPRKME